MAINYTVAPFPLPFQFFYPDGTPVSGGQLYTFQAGQGPQATTYRNSSGTPNTNPIILDAGGRAAIFLAPGSYYFALYDSVANGGALIATEDNVTAITAAANQQTIPGIAGASLTDGQCVYLSDGSGSLTAGRWYPAQANNAYSSTVPEVGFVIGNTSAGTAGTILLIGQVVSGVTVTVGLFYYIDPTIAGAITSTKPSNARIVGFADSGTSIVVNPPIPSILDNTVCDGRLTLTTGVPVTTADVTAATSLIFTPYRGNRIALYTGTTWEFQTFAEISIPVPATTVQMYDVFGFANAGALTLELLAWTNDTTRAIALVLQDGILCKTGVLTRRYLGSFRTTGVSGQTEDSLLKRYVWNYYNRVPRMLQRFESTASWTYSTATVRQANGSTANQVDLVLGVAESPLDLALTTGANASGNQIVSVGIGENATTTYVAGQTAVLNVSGSSLTVRLVKIPAVGRNFYSWNEWSGAVSTTTWNGAVTGVGSTITSGLVGSIDG